MDSSGDRPANDYGFFAGPGSASAVRSPKPPVEDEPGWNQAGGTAAGAASAAAAGGYQPASYAFSAPAPTPAVPPPPAYTLETPAVPAYTPVVPAPTAPAPATVLVAAPEAPEAAYARATTESGVDEDDVSLNDLLDAVMERSASDLHLTADAHPMIRQNGELVPLDEYPKLSPAMIQRVLYAALTQKQREKFEEKLELDFSYALPGRARFRVNLYRQRESVGAAFRIIPFEIRKLEDLGVPPIVSNFAMLPRGFVLVTGPTGSGKSTTLASLIDSANRNRRGHIMTCEDPIEFLHEHKGCIINQREVGEDTLSFANALKHVLRQDPDIILVGEMRDLETISVALTAAETGHLVFGTLHTQDAAQTVDRVIDVFPPEQQQQVRVQLAGSLQGVVCQTLCKTADGRGRAVATEVLVATPAIRNLIREGKTHQIYSSMQAGAKFGMHTMDQHLAELVRNNRITYEQGLEKCHHVEDFNRLTGRG
ncbi:MAG: type IV pilus twitching motility protein PilT [Actinomycetota bacterium]|nr:type IV pilus twitching motility protein PilT [Actinomycetota bacterium]